MYIPSSERVEFVEGLIVQFVYDDLWEASALSREVFVRFPEKTKKYIYIWCHENLFTDSSSQLLITFFDKGRGRGRGRRGVWRFLGNRKICRRGIFRTTCNKKGKV